jgi:hypothetical protein
MGSQGRRRRRAQWICALSLALVGLVASPAAHAASFALRMTRNATLGGTAFKKHDIVLYDSDADSASLLLSRDVWNRNTKLDAFQQFSDGTVLVSHSNNGVRTIGGLDMTRGDVALYDPDSDVATLLMAETAFNKATDVDAAHRLPNGNLLFSVKQARRTMGGITFLDGDVVEYDPLAGTAAVVFSESLFEGKAADVDGIQQGSIIISVRENGVTLAGVSFGQNDVVRYDTGTGTASIVIDGTEVPANTQLFAVFAPALPPEPPGFLMLASGIAGLLLFPRVSQRRDPADGR